MKRLVVLFFVLSLFSLSVTPSHAFEFKSDETIETSSESSTNGSLFIAGKRVTVRGTVNGDLFCAGQNVVIEGTVTGDVMCAAQTITITGTVSGDVRVAAQQILLQNIVSGNFTGAAQSLTLGPLSMVTGEVVAAGQQYWQDGTIGKSLAGGFQTATVNGKVGGDVELKVEDLVLGSQSSILGKLSYESQKEVSKPATASISGTVMRREPPVQKRSRIEKEITINKSVGTASWVMKIIAYIVTAFLLAVFFPDFVRKTTATIAELPGRSFLLGFLSFLVIPVLLLLFIITLIGIPVAILGGFVWIFFLFVSRLLIGLFVGEKVLTQIKSSQKNSPIWTAVVGIVLTAILFKIPFLGALLSMVAVTVGFGAMLQLLPAFKKK